MKTTPNVLFHGEFLQAVEKVEPASVALLYVDPPFGTGRAQPYRFGLREIEPPMADRGGRDAWLEVWVPRLLRGMLALRPGGILVVHLDPRIAPFLRVRLEERLGPGSFLDEIVWHYRSGGVARDRFSWKHDTLLVWRNGSPHHFRPIREKRYLAHRASRRGVEEHRDRRGWFRHAWADDVWEIPFLPADSRERLGYPTQKPEGLALRLIEAFTDPGETIADWTCGSGTTAAAAQRLGRRWLLADRDARAIACAAGRLLRLLDPSLGQRWRSATVSERKADLGARLARLRSDPSGWGFDPEEREAWLRLEPGLGFRIVPAAPAPAAGRVEG